MGKKIKNSNNYKNLNNTFMVFFFFVKDTVLDVNIIAS